MIDRILVVFDGGLNYMLDLLNENSGAFLVVFTFVVAISTAVYAKLTKNLVSETKKMREVQTEPKISITIQPREESILFIDMIIHNIGLGPAYNIKFETSDDFEYKSGKKLCDINLFKRGIKYLAPNQKVQFFFTSMSEKFEYKVKNPLGIGVNYQNSKGKIYGEEYTIDFSELIGLRELGEPPLYKIAKHIEEIQKDIRHLSSGFKKLQTVVYTREDIKEEESKLLEEFKQRSEDKNREHQEE